MVTALEGELVVSHVRKKSWQKWLAGQLTSRGNTVCHLTMNEWAEQCISGNYPGEDPGSDSLEPCQFLAADYSCSIYEARPFACRCFASLIPCRESGTASQPRDLLAINTVVMQIIEHLDQGEIYGSLGNILTALCNREEYNDIAVFLPSRLRHDINIHNGLRRARPLPGLVTESEDRAAVRLFIEILFQEKINDKSLQYLLNHG